MFGLCSPERLAAAHPSGSRDGALVAAAVIGAVMALKKIEEGL
jgi:hypothetical protein